MTIRPKTKDEIEVMRQSGLILNSVLKQTANYIKPGLSLDVIDAFIADIIKQNEASPSFFHYKNYPASSCLSVNEAVVHGIPTDYKLKEGDILGIDVGVKWQGYHTDAAVTLAIGAISPERRQLLAVTQAALRVGVESALAGNTVGDVGAAIEDYIRSQGKFGIIRDLSGHGIGQNLQESPEILNYRTHNPMPLVNNMTLAIEPMVSLGDWQVEVSRDGWTIATKDHAPAAHFETTIVVTDNDPEVLVAFPLTCVMFQNKGH